MGEKTAIAWTDHTHNLWWGCTKQSPACDFCYAEAWAKRTGYDVWDGKPLRLFADAHYLEPLKWERRAARDGVVRRVFCQSMGDICDPAGPRERVSQLFGIIKQTPHLHWLLLTKLPWRFAKILPADWGDGYPNVMLMCTAENQEWAGKRIPKLLSVPARAYGVSIEPMLGPVNLGGYLYPIATPGHCVSIDGEWWHMPGGCAGAPLNCNRRCCRDALSWVIVGGESGPRARPFDVAGARRLRDQCRGAGAAFFMKQLGARPIDSRHCDVWGPTGGHHYTRPVGDPLLDEARRAPGYRVTPQDLRRHIRHRAGADPSEWDPQDRVQEFPR